MTLTARLAAHFAAHPNRWLDGQDLAKVAGSYAWRTRASELRKPPYGMTIENRVRTLRSLTGKTYRVSEYRLSQSRPSCVSEAAWTPIKRRLRESFDKSASAC